MAPETIRVAQHRSQNDPSVEDQASLLKRSNLVEDYAGRLVFADNHLISHDPVSEELIAKGVIWMPIEEAFYKKPELNRLDLLSWVFFPVTWPGV